MTISISELAGRIVDLETEIARLKRSQPTARVRVQEAVAKARGAEREQIAKMLEERADKMPYPGGKVVADELMSLAADIRKGLRKERSPAGDWYDDGIEKKVPFR